MLAYRTVLIVNGLNDNAGHVLLLIVHQGEMTVARGEHKLAQGLVVKGIKATKCLVFLWIHIQRL